MVGGELFIESHDGLRPIAKDYPKIEAEFLLARTTSNVHYSLEEAKKGAYAPVISTWYRWSGYSVYLRRLLGASTCVSS